MKIEVTREDIEGSQCQNGKNCVCARAITRVTGRPVSIGTIGGCFHDGSIESFNLDEAGCCFVDRNISCGLVYGEGKHEIKRKRWFRKPVIEIVQPTGSFEISWNPPAKNWSYKTVRPQVLEEELA